MDTTAILETFQKTAGLEAGDVNYLLEHAQLQNFSKNTHILREGDAANHFYLIRSGCLMTYFTDVKDGIYVMQFGTEMWWTGDLDGFVKGIGSTYSIRTVLDSEVYIIEKALFDHVLARSPGFERYFRIIFQNALISHQRRIMRNISFTAEERYEEFLKLYPRMELIIPQKYIASYLGITPEFLSKIRRKMAGK